MRRPVPPEVREAVQTMRRELSLRIGKHLEYSCVEELMIRAGLQRFSTPERFENLVRLVKERTA
jgi:hypothetical protein